MNENQKAVFRTNSLRRHTDEPAQDLLPRFVSPGCFVALWLLVGLLGGSMLTLWLAVGGG